MSHFYSMSYREVMDMPLRAFWSFSGCVGRISAEIDMRALHVAAASQSGDAFKSQAAALKEEMGNVSISVDTRRDEDATAKLKRALAG